MAFLFPTVALPVPVSFTSVVALLSASCCKLSCGESAGCYPSNERRTVVCKGKWLWKMVGTVLLEKEAKRSYMMSGKEKE
jgi:hypothetical protein